MSREQDVDAALAAWDEELATIGRVTLRPSRGKMLLALLGALVFTALGIALLVLPDAPSAARLAGVLAAGFFGVVGVPSLVIQLVRAREAVTIDDAGIHAPRQFDLPWEEVRGVGVFSVRGSRSVTFGVDDAYAQRLLAGRSPVWRSVARANATLTGGHALALPGTLRVDAEALATWIAKEAERRVGTAVGTAMDDRRPANA